MRTHDVDFVCANFKILLRLLHDRCALQGSPKGLLQAQTPGRAGYTPCGLQGAVPAASLGASWSLLYSPLMSLSLTRLPSTLQLMDMAC